MLLICVEGKLLSRDGTGKDGDLISKTPILY